MKNTPHFIVSGITTGGEQRKLLLGASIQGSNFLKHYHNFSNVD